jgi:hypothetical protein
MDSEKSTRPFGQRGMAARTEPTLEKAAPAKVTTNNIVAPAATRAIFDRLKLFLDRQGQIQGGDFISIVAALGGFAAQQAVWRCLIEPAQHNAGDYLVRVRTKQGDTLYFGDATNVFLTSTHGRLSFYALAAGGVPSDQLPDLGEIFRYVSSMLEPNFAAVRLPTAHGKFLPPRAALDTHWGWVEKALLGSGHPASEWPAILGFVSQWVIRGAATSNLPTPLGLKLLMETAIFMSKVDPRFVPGASAGIRPPEKWSNRALTTVERPVIRAEVEALLPKQLGA